jgi:flagellar protein FlbD
VITLHKLNGDQFVLNADLIISVEANPDTLISMVDRRTMLVREPVVDVVGAVMDYRRAVSTGQHLVPVAGEAR